MLNRAEGAVAVRIHHHHLVMVRLQLLGDLEPEFARSDHHDGPMLTRVMPRHEMQKHRRCHGHRDDRHEDNSRVDRFTDDLQARPNRRRRDN